MAIFTLRTKHVKVTPAFLLTVVAQNHYDPILQLVWHWCRLNFIIKLPILLPHVTERLLTERTLELVLRKFSETGSVHRMSTFQVN